MLTKSCQKAEKNVVCDRLTGRLNDQDQEEVQGKANEKRWRKGTLAEGDTRGETCKLQLK